MFTRRLPVPALRPFVTLLWASDGEAGSTTEVRANAAAGAPRSRELVLPTGAMHLVYRLSPEPLRLFDAMNAPTARDAGHAVLGGARATYYVRDISTPSRSVGAMLKPGASRLLFGGSAAELAGVHTPLSDLWGAGADRIRERLLAARTPSEQLDLLEALLLARLPRVRGLHPAVAEALVRLGHDDVGAIVASAGVSHRRFVDLFAGAVGLTPKRYARVQRFRRTLQRLAASPRVSLATLAADAGYADQAHFNRDFREMAGLSPTEYLAAAPRNAHHVPVR